MRTNVGVTGLGNQVPRLLLLALLLAGALTLAATPATRAAGQAGVTAGSLPPGSVRDAPAVAEFFGGPWQLVVVRTNDNRLFWTAGTGTGDDGLPPVWSAFGWQEIPGGARSFHAPAVAQYGDRMYVAIVADDQRIHLQSVDRYWNWTAGWQAVPGNTFFAGAPTLAGYFGSLWVFAPAWGQQLYYQVYWPGWNNGWTLVPGGVRSTGAAVAEFNNVLHIVARSTESRIYHQTAGWGWSGWREIPGWGLTYHAPALAKSTVVDFASQRLYVLVRGTQDGLACQDIDTNSEWSAGWHHLPGGGRTPYAPGLESRQGYLRAYAVGHDNRLYFLNLRRDSGSGLLINWDTPGWTLVPRQ